MNRLLGVIVGSITTITLLIWLASDGFFEPLYGMDLVIISLVTGSGLILVAAAMWLSKL